MKTMNELREQIDKILKSYVTIVKVHDFEDLEEFKCLGNDLIAEIREHFEV